MTSGSSTAQAHDDASPRTFAGLAGDFDGVVDLRPPLVFLHGMTFDRSTWAPVLNELDRIDPDRRILNLDLPGHGQSRPALPHTMAAIVTA